MKIKNIVILCVLFFLPVISIGGASLLYLSGWQSDSTRNHGYLMQTQMAYPGEVGKGQWLLLVQEEECSSASCQQAFRNLHTALGKHRERVSMALIGDEVANDQVLSLRSKVIESAIETVEQDNQRNMRLFLVDPAGWPVLAYDAEHTDEQILGDIKRLL
jgi:hypothetical protein